MSHRRTRHQKLNPHYHFLASVKRDLALGGKESSSKANEVKKAENQAKEPGTRDIRKDILRTLFITTLILALEVVLYLAWYV